MRIGVVQFFPLFGGVARNIARAVGLVREEQADLWVLPELFATGYQFMDRREAMRLAEGVDGPTVQTLRSKAREMSCWFCGGFPEVDGQRLYNSAFLTGPDGSVSVYRKMHLFDREKEIFDPGDRGFVVVDIGAAKVGMMICFDWVFPESVRTLMLMGADVVAHPSNLVLPHCPDAMKTRALENRVFTATANRVGVEERVPGLRLEFIGSSIIYGPGGQRLACAGRGEDCALSVEVDVLRARDKRVTARNDLLADRRVTFYRSE